MTQATDLEVLQGGGDAHAHGVDAAVGTICPTCEQPITVEQFHQIRRRIEAEDRKQAEETKAALAEVRSDAEAKAASQIAALEHKSTQDLAALKEQAANQFAEAEKRKTAELAAARVEATRAATKASHKKVTEAEEKTKAATDQLVAMKESHTKELAVARMQATQLANEAATKKLAEEQDKTKAATEELENLKQSHDETLTERLTQQREALEEDKLKAVNQTKAEAFKKNQKVEAQVARLTRQLQQKSSNELGEGAEIDLFDALKTEFPDDKITRVKKGEQGADVRQEVMEGKTSCGEIIWDSKSRNAWQNAFVKKLKTDQLAAKASFAILTTHVFPSGASQIHVQEGVIVLNPARAVAVATLLRQQMIQMKTQNLSQHAREEKMALIYAFITSEQFSQLTRRMEDLTLKLLDLDVNEQKAHERMWMERGSVTKSLQKAQGQLVSEIERIVIEGNADVAEAG